MLYLLHFFQYYLFCYAIRLTLMPFVSLVITSVAILLVAIAIEECNSRRFIVVFLFQEDVFFVFPFYCFQLDGCFIPIFSHLLAFPAFFGYSIPMVNWFSPDAIPYTLYHPKSSNWVYTLNSMFSISGISSCTRHIGSDVGS